MIFQKKEDPAPEEKFSYRYVIGSCLRVARRLAKDEDAFMAVVRDSEETFPQSKEWLDDFVRTNVLPDLRRRLAAETKHQKRQELFAGFRIKKVRKAAGSNRRSKHG